MAHANPANKLNSVPKNDVPSHPLIKYNLMKLCWHMRGGLSVNEAYDLSPEDREIIHQLVKDNMEVAKKTGQPYW